jgi:hypothetical protein
MDAGDNVLTARVASGSPLLRRGLARAASAAGFVVVPAGSEADVTLGVGGTGQAREINRSVVNPARCGGVDVRIEAGAVVMTVREVPTIDTLRMLRVLVCELLEDLSGTCG